MSIENFKKPEPQDVENDDESSLFGKSNGPLQQRGHGIYNLRTQRKKNYNEAKYEADVSERMDEHSDYINGV